MFYLDAMLAPGARLPLPDDHEDRGAYVLFGGERVAIAGERFRLRDGDDGVPPRRSGVDDGRGGAGRAGGHASGRRDAGGAALHLVELRRLLQGAPIEAAKEAWREGDWAARGAFKLPPTDNGGVSSRCRTAEGTVRLVARQRVAPTVPAMGHRFPPPVQSAPRAIAFILAGMVCISLNDMLIKLLSDGYPLHQMVFVPLGHRESR